MDIIEYREFCMSLPLTEEAMPFGDDTLVFKVGGKMFTLSGVDNFDWINLKCDPQKAIELRELYSDITPGFHMHKKHWNTIRVDGDLREDFIREMIEDSYMLVVKSLPAAQREPIMALLEQIEKK